MTQRSLMLTPAASIRTRRQRWLWKDRIPLGTVTIFAGRGGEGKSTFALHVGAQAIRGELEGDIRHTPTSVLIISHEDDWGTVMNPRLTAAGADLNHVFKLSVQWREDELTGETVPAFPVDLTLIREAVEATGARIILIDPITSTIGGDQYKVADVRRALDPLAQLAQELDIAVIAIMHLTKGGGNASDKLSGSHAFRDVVRSVMLFATDDDTGQRIVSVDKANYSKERGSSFAFNLVSTTVPTDDGEFAEVARVEYLGETDINVSDIINREPRAENDDEDRNAAQAFIVDYLKHRDGCEANAGDVIKAGRAAGFSESEMKNARKRCKSHKIESRKSGFGAGWVWGMSGEGVSQGVQGVTPAESDTFEPFVTPSRDPEATLAEVTA